MQFAIAMTCLGFCAFLLFVASWLGHLVQPSDVQAVAIPALLATAMGLSQGIHARLKSRDPSSMEFHSEPGAFDLASLSLSVLLLIGGLVTIGRVVIR